MLPNIWGEMPTGPQLLERAIVRASRADEVRQNLYVIHHRGAKIGYAIAVSNLPNIYQSANAHIQSISTAYA